MLPEDLHLIDMQEVLETSVGLPRNSRLGNLNLCLSTANYNEFSPD